MAEITIVGDILCSPRMTEIANGDYSPLFDKANKLNRAENEVAFTLETAYFGTSDNTVSPDKLLQLGHCFAKALGKYIEIN